MFFPPAVPFRSLGAFSPSYLVRTNSPGTEKWTAGGNNHPLNRKTSQTRSTCLHLTRNNYNGPTGVALLQSMSSININGFIGRFHCCFVNPLMWRNWTKLQTCHQLLFCNLTYAGMIQIWISLLVLEEAKCFVFFAPKCHILSFVPRTFDSLDIWLFVALNDMISTALLC